MLLIKKIVTILKTLFEFSNRQIKIRQYMRRNSEQREMFKTLDSLYKDYEMTRPFEGLKLKEPMLNVLRLFRLPQPGFFPYELDIL